MSRRSVLICLGVWAAISASCVADVPEPVSLNGQWRFKWVTDAKQADPYRWFFERGFDFSAWDTIAVPSHWALLGYEDPRWVDGSPAEGFYFRTFTAPQAARGLRTVLHFDGVWVSAEVWLNGQALGRHDSGFTPFAFDVTDVLKPGAENLLAVRVRQQIPALLYKFDANDDWALAGIYRDVWLEFMPKEMYIAGVETETDFDSLFQDADLNARVFIVRLEDADYFAPSSPFEIRAILCDANGKEVMRDSRTATINNAHNGNAFTLSMHVATPAPWTAETPTLYTLSVELVRDGHVVHTWRDRIGFREVSTAGGVLRINGQAVKLRGVARHDQHPDVGRATRREHWLQDIELMKAANVNAVRTVHYPPAEGFIRLCDEMGLYVIDEIPLGFAGERMDNPIFAAGMFLRLHETIQRDRNRPSVIVWSFGNEDPFTRLHFAGLRAVKGLDKTRPVLLPFRAELDLPDEVDILAPHYWLAVDNDRLAGNSTRPVITTEFTHALGRHDFGEFEQRWQALIQHPAGAGGMIWLWADEGLRRPIDGREVLHPMEDKDKYERKDGRLIRESDAGPGEIYDTHGNWGADGIVDADRTPQRDYWEAKAVYAPIEIVRDRIPFKPGQRSVFVDVRNGYDFLDLSTFDLRWRLFRNAELLDSGTTRLQAPPHTTATLAIPTTTVKAEDTEAVYYIHLTSTHPDGGEITTESIRLGFDRAPQPPGPARPEKPQISRTQSRTVVTVGPVRYAFDPASGQIAGISIAGKPLAGASNLVVWRPATYCERNRLDLRPNQHDWNTYMQGLAGVTKKWDIAESDQAVTISVETEHRADNLNSVIARTSYRIAADGTLRIELEVEPHLDVPEIPEIGIELAVPKGLQAVQWLGEGPIDSLPGKAEATYFGWWRAEPGDPVAQGTKSGLEWARLIYGHGAALHVKNCTGVRLENLGEQDHAWRILTNVAAPWTKNGPPERKEWQLNLSENKTFSGSFELVPLP
jgi:beta-galactosidase